jgi:hypothetical protein
MLVNGEAEAPKRGAVLARVPYKAGTPRYWLNDSPRLHQEQLPYEALAGTTELSSRPERTQISYFSALARTTGLDRKSGGA